MLIPPRYNRCIWCRHSFALAGFKERPGEVRRSLEHVIPASLFGHLLTQDVCNNCNSSLGSDVDSRLLNDGGVFTAGLAAGFKANELLKDFRVAGQTPEGEPFEYRVKDGKWRLEPEFTPSGFKIGAVEGLCVSCDLENAKRKMLKIVMANASLGLSDRDAKRWVDDLFQEFVEKKAECEVYRAAIRQRLRRRPIRARGNVSFVTNPWETQWCVAKVAYESGAVLLPEKLRRIAHSALEQLRGFVEVQRPMRGMFRHKTLKVQARPSHKIDIRAHGSSLEFRVRLFGREQWTLGFEVLRRGVPAELEDYHLEVGNECIAPHRQAVSVIENGAEIGFR